MRRVIFFLAMVAILLFCVWFLFEVLEYARPRKLPAVQQQERSARSPDPYKDRAYCGQMMPPTGMRPG